MVPAREYPDWHHLSSGEIVGDDSGESCPYYGISRKQGDISCEDVPYREGDKIERNSGNENEACNLSMMRIFCWCVFRFTLHVLLYLSKEEQSGFQSASSSIYVFRVCLV